LKIMPKGIDMDTWELFYTYKFSKEWLAINEQHTNQNNILLKLSLNKR
jgi:hypothetical protein